MTVFAACEGYSAGLEEQRVPADRNLALNLLSLPETGSAIFDNKGGSVPILRGRIAPIRDNPDGAYVYASNITINDGKQQLVTFAFGEDLAISDADGNDALITFVSVIGKATLVEYRRSNAGQSRSPV